MTIIEVLARPLTPFSAHSSPPCRRTISRATCIQSYFSEAQALDVKHRAPDDTHAGPRGRYFTVLAAGLNSADVSARGVATGYGRRAAPVGRAADGR